MRFWSGRHNWRNFPDTRNDSGDALSITFSFLPDGGAPSSFSASFGGTTLASLTNLSASGYIDYSIGAIAAGVSTVLAFNFRRSRLYDSRRGRRRNTAPGCTPAFRHRSWRAWVDRASLLFCAAPQGDYLQAIAVAFTVFFTVPFALGISPLSASSHMPSGGSGLPEAILRAVQRTALRREVLDWGNNE